MPTRFSRTRGAAARAFVRNLHQTLERDGQLVYMSFNHPEAVELVQCFQEIDARRYFNDNRENPYGVEDTNVWGILHPDYQRMQKALWTLMREAETEVGRAFPVSQQRPEHFDPMVRRMHGLLAGDIEENVRLAPYMINNRKEPMEVI